MEKNGNVKCQMSKHNLKVEVPTELNVTSKHNTFFVTFQASRGISSFPIVPSLVYMHFPQHSAVHLLYGTQNWRQSTLLYCRFTLRTTSPKLTARLQGASTVTPEVHSTRTAAGEAVPEQGDETGAGKCT